MTLVRRSLLQGAALLTVPVLRSAAAESVPAPKEAQLYIIWPKDGQRIRGAFPCRFGLRNMGVAPAGIASPNAGHHHLLIDVKEPISPDLPIPSDKKHMHFGSGQTETQLELPPGTHTLQLVLGDANHMPFEPVVASRKIRIVVV